jgi:hypothetical protein
MDSGYKRAILLWHRRCGKDKTVLNMVVKKMLERVGMYFYIFPTFTQAKRVIWDGKDKDGFSFLDHFPKELIERINETELKITLKNGSSFQLIGSDNYDAVRGTNPIGVVFSEYAFQNPIVWDVIRPILSQNDGWAVFVYTPNGNNHGQELYQMGVDNSEWFVQKLSVEDTHAISLEAVEAERQAGMDEQMIQQEYYVSFDAGMKGAYYSEQLEKARKENRIGSVPYNPNGLVSTYWDLGIDDAMAIWFVQTVGQEVHIIDYLENDGEGVDWYKKQLSEKGYNYSMHYWPHDGEQRELSTGRSRKDTAEALGLKPIEIIPQHNVIDGINQARAVFNRCWFDKEKCKQGIKALENYTKEWDDKRKVFRLRPAHTWASHAADAWRYFAMGYKETKSVQPSNILHKRIQRSRHSAVVR